MRYLVFGLALSLTFLGGCESDQQKVSDDVDGGQVALGGGRYDAAVTYADMALRVRPDAQAYYLRARAEEDRPKPDALITGADLNKARLDYLSAIQLHPGEPLESRCRAGVANIAFSQGDYDSADFQWTMSLGGLDQPDWKANALYHIALCQQRLGRFDDADKTFARLRREYPDQDATTRAIERQGVRAFYVQIGTFATIADAQAAQKVAQSAGVKCQPVPDQGLTALRCGPYNTYAEAQRAQGAVAGQFPKAIIGP